MENYIVKLLPEGEERDEREHERDNQDGVELCVAVDGEAAEIEGEEPSDEGEGIAEVADSEYRPSHHRYDEGDDDAWCFADFLVEFLQSHAFEHEPDAVVGTPHHEVPACAMPEAGEEEHQPEVEVHAVFRATVAAERDIEVVAHESTQRDVPTTPELGDARRVIWVVEVLREVEAHDAAETDGHVGIGGEVEVKMHGVGNYRDPGGAGAHSGKVGGKKLFGLKSDDIGDDNFLGETYYETAETLQKLLRAVAAVAYLTLDVAVTHDRTGDELRKHRDVNDVVGEALHRIVVTSIGVENVGYRLEGEKRDAYRKRHFRHQDGIDAKQPRERIEIVNQEVSVFVIDQKPETYRYSEAAVKLFQTWFTGFSHQLHEIEVGDGRADEQ